MASSKKQKQRSRAAATRPAHIGANVAAEETSVPTAAPTQEAVADAPARRSDSVDWTNEYSYVISDLKQMAVVTAGLFAALIVIGFFL